MGTIIPFDRMRLDRYRKPIKPGKMGKIVFFTGVRIDRQQRVEEGPEQPEPQNPGRYGGDKTTSH